MTGLDEVPGGLDGGRSTRPRDRQRRDNSDDDDVEYKQKNCRERSNGVLGEEPTTRESLSQSRYRLAGELGTYDMRRISAFQNVSKPFPKINSKGTCQTRPKLRREIRKVEQKERGMVQKRTLGLTRAEKKSREKQEQDCCNHPNHQP